MKRVAWRNLGFVITLAGVLLLPLGAFAQEPEWLFDAPAGVTWLRLSPDAGYVVVRHGDGTSLFQPHDDGSGRILQTRLPSGDVTEAGFSPDGRWLAMVYREGDLYLYDVGAQSGRFLSVGEERIGPIEQFAFSPDGETIAALVSDPWGAVAFDLEGEVLARVEFVFRNDPWGVGGMAISNNGRWAIVSVGRELFEWDFGAAETETDISGTWFPGDPRTFPTILPLGDDGWLAGSDSIGLVRPAQGERIVRRALFNHSDAAIRDGVPVGIRSAGNAIAYASEDVSWLLTMPTSTSRVALTADGLRVGVLAGSTVYVHRAPVYLTHPRLFARPDNPSCGGEVDVSTDQTLEGLTLDPVTFVAEQVGVNERGIKVTDAYGWHTTSTVSVVVSRCEGLEAAFTWTPVEGAPGHIQFRDTSTAPPGSSIARLYWYAYGSVEKFSMERNPVFTYRSAGTYEVELVVFDAQFNREKIKQEIELTLDDSEEVSP